MRDPGSPLLQVPAMATQLQVPAPDRPVYRASMCHVVFDQSMDGMKPKLIHRPNRRYTRRQSTLQQHKENMELRCCRINVLLVTMQTFLGITITALGFYMRTLTLSLQYYECPFWAGIPLSLTGTIGMYLCATDFKAYTGSTKMMVVKAVCFTLSAICMFVAIVAAVFVGIHGHRIASYDECKWYNNSKNTSTCECTIDKLDPDARIYIYEGVRRCNLIFSSIKDYLILECALTSVASGVSVWFVILLWKSRYQKFSGSLRLYSYSGGQTSHPVGQNPCASLNASNAEDPERRHSSFQVQGALQKRLLEECRQKEREQFGYSHNSEET
ncbi:sarcospan-like isoform X2 [Lineus longissimus]|uniref:sarcospan-like isoform X2 n=1 Tax=Lineus longissimus TaxID=88925 RepID=UPI002B4EED89